MVGNTIRTLFEQTRAKMILMVLNNSGGEMSSRLMEQDQIRLCFNDAFQIFARGFIRRGHGHDITLNVSVSAHI